MGVFRFSLRLPSDLHSQAEALVSRRQLRDPGASLNSLICEALADYIARLKSKEVFTVTKFHIEPMKVTGLLCIDSASSPTMPLNPKLQLDRDGSLSVKFYSSSDNAVTMDVWHNQTLEWDLSLSIDAERLTEAINAGELDELLTRVQAGHTVEWDGSNHVGRLSEDGSDASEEVQKWLNGFEDTLPDGGGLWDAGDWFVDGPQSVTGLTAATTDDELDALVGTLEAEALTDNVVLYDTASCLRQFREQLQEELAEQAESLAEALNGYEGEDRWNDVVLSSRFRKLVDEDATEAADPSGASDIVVLIDGTRVCYYEAEGKWQVQR